jgi:hypothetical protein
LQGIFAGIVDNLQLPTVAQSRITPVDSAAVFEIKVEFMDEFGGYSEVAIDFYATATIQACAGLFSRKANLLCMNVFLAKESS